MNEKMRERGVDMEPTKALKEFWDIAPDGEEMKQYYYCASKTYQKCVNALANATNDECDFIINFLATVSSFALE